MELVFLYDNIGWKSREVVIFREYIYFVIVVVIIVLCYVFLGIFWFCLFIVVIFLDFGGI